jgi:type IV secretory pathway VirB10-like protein
MRPRRSISPATAPLTGAAPPPRAKMLNRRLIMAAAIAAALVVAAAAGLALQSPSPRDGDTARPAKAATGGLLPKGLADLPDGYGDAARIAQYLPAPAGPQTSPEMAARIAQIEAQAAALQKQLDHALSVITELQQQAQKPAPPEPLPAPVPAPGATGAGGPREGELAASSGLFFNAGAPGGRGAALPGKGLGRPGADAALPFVPEPSSGPSAGGFPGASLGESYGGASGQGSGSGSGALWSPDQASSASGGALADGASAVTRIAPFSVAAGTIIPSSLITGINSDIPGTLVAQVRENVYDTLTGRHLLIPQGSKLVGVYGADVIYGQERVRSAFTRLIRPDGASVNLAGAEAADTAGMAGLADEVDNHWFKLIAGALLSATFTIGATASQGTPSGYYPSPAQGAAANVANSVSQSGQTFAQRQLDQKPTITVRPGFSFDIIVTQDLVLPPVGAAVANRPPTTSTGSFVFHVKDAVP